MHWCLKEEDRTVQGFFSECIKLYWSHQGLAVHCVCVCGLWSLPHSAVLTDDSELLLKDKSVKEERTCLQLYKHS